jgi:energy-coupling factor transport system ATP-binding protein
LILSDESTAMLDPEGRRAVIEDLRSAADDGVAVVHVTHLEAERMVADRVVTLSQGRLHDDTVVRHDGGEP